MSVLSDKIRQEFGESDKKRDVGLKTPEDVIDGSLLYLRVMYIGILATGLYNGLAAFLRAVGDSMEPKIHDGDFCVVRKIGAVDYDNRIVLVQRNDKAADPETGGAYLLKKFARKGGKVLLRPLNGDYRDIEIARGDDLKIVAEFKTVLRA